jgi:hypothetical protein
MKLSGKPWLVLAAAMLGGASIWALSRPFTGQVEPWDSLSSYYAIALLMAGAFAALPGPRYWWLVPIGVFTGEHLYMWTLLPESRAWWLFGIYIHAQGPVWLLPAIGAGCVYVVDLLRRKLRTRRTARPVEGAEPT